jgi:hypothetical protein
MSTRGTGKALFTAGKTPFRKLIVLCNTHSSVTNTIETQYHSRMMYFLSLTDRVTALYTNIFYEGWGEMFGGDFERNGRDAFRRQHDLVVNHAKPERLLVYEVGEGWEPLCKFLDLPIPDVDFPRGNDKESFHASCWELDRSRLMVVLGKGLVGVVGGAICFAAWGWLGK